MYKAHSHALMVIILHAMSFKTNLLLLFPVTEYRSTSVFLSIFVYGYEHSKSLVEILTPVKGFKLTIAKYDKHASYFLPSEQSDLIQA